MELKTASEWVSMTSFRMREAFSHSFFLHASQKIVCPISKLMHLASLNANYVISFPPSPHLGAQQHVREKKSICPNDETNSGMLLRRSASKITDKKTLSCSVANAACFFALKQFKVRKSFILQEEVSISFKFYNSAWAKKRALITNTRLFRRT